MTAMTLGLILTSYLGFGAVVVSVFKYLGGKRASTDSVKPSTATRAGEMNIAPFADWSPRETPRAPIFPNRGDMIAPFAR